MAKRKKTRKSMKDPQPAKEVDGLELAMMDRPDVKVLNFDKLQNAATDSISGSAADLIRDGHDLPRRWLHNSEALPDDRRKAFLVGRGWSATRSKRQILASANIPVMAINDFPIDAPKPDYWCSGDPPSYFGERIWNDHELLKFAPIDFAKITRPREDAYAPELNALHAPNVHFFHHVNNEVEFESWLHTPWIAWGTSIHGPDVPKQFYKEGAARSSMLIGLRLLWHLGFREVYLLGCDCTPHSHPAPEYWNTIFYLLEQIKPTLDRWGFNVYQTNFDAHLRVFPMVEFNDAIDAKCIADEEPETEPMYCVFDPHTNKVHIPNVLRSWAEQWVSIRAPGDAQAHMEVRPMPQEVA